MVLAIAYTESSVCYDVTHPDIDTVGIGGIKQSFHCTEAPTNSLMAIDEVYTKYLDTYKSKYTALKKYKGTVTNFTSYNRTLATYHKLEKIHHAL